MSSRILGLSVRGAAYRPSSDEAGQVEPEEGNFIQEAWSRYVLLRPGMDMDGLRNSTKLRTARSWSWSAGSRGGGSPRSRSGWTAGRRDDRQRCKRARPAGLVDGPRSEPSGLAA